MLSHVQIFCFLASYTVALALEVSRLWFRSGIRGIVMLGFVVAGWIAHTAFLYNSAVAAVAAAGSPLSSNRDWLLLAAWVLVMVYFYLACYHPATHFGVFLLPLVLGLIAAARFADPNTFPREPFQDLGRDSRHFDPAGHGHGALRLCRGVDVPGAGRSPEAQAAALSEASASQPRVAANGQQPDDAGVDVAGGRCRGLGHRAESAQGQNSPGVPWNDPVVLGHAGDVRLASLARRHRRVLPAHPPGPQGGLLDAGQFHLSGRPGGDVRRPRSTAARRRRRSIAN